MSKTVIFIHSGVSRVSNFPSKLLLAKIPQRRGRFLENETLLVHLHDRGERKISRIELIARRNITALDWVTSIFYFVCLLDLKCETKVLLTSHCFNSLVSRKRLARFGSNWRCFLVARLIIIPLPLSSFFIAIGIVIIIGIVVNRERARLFSNASASLVKISKAICGALQADVNGPRSTRYVSVYPEYAYYFCLMLDTRAFIIFYLAIFIILMTCE